MKKIVTVALVAFVILLAGSQLVRPARTNPPVDAPLAIRDPAVESVLRRSCFDCHSNETRWPWYSTVAPVSWLLVSDVNEARHEMNFSSWKDPKRELRKEMCEQVREGEMPLWFYIPLHPDARLSEADIRILCDWGARSSGGTPIAEAPDDDD